MNTKLIHDHDDKCTMKAKIAAGEVTHPWWVDPEHIQVKWKDQNGTLHSNGVSWVRLWCEDTHCPGQLLVKLEWLLTKAQEDLEASRVAA